MKNTYSNKNRKPVIRVRVKSRVRFITGINETTASVNEDYVSYIVADGDTVWDIAQKLNTNDTDIRKVVFAICQINDITAGDLQPGMVLTVPADL